MACYGVQILNQPLNSPCTVFYDIFSLSFIINWRLISSATNDGVRDLASERADREGHLTLQVEGGWRGSSRWGVGRRSSSRWGGEAAGGVTGKASCRW
uniref:Uncharacterized protein n=1 Tax=Setaria italica TaxID=4555 RepID=K4AKR0_SETIT